MKIDSFINSFRAFGGGGEQKFEGDSVYQTWFISVICRFGVHYRYR